MKITKRGIYVAYYGNDKVENNRYPNNSVFFKSIKEASEAVSTSEYYAKKSITQGIPVRNMRGMTFTFAKLN